MNKPAFTPPQNVKEVLERLQRPKTAVITGGMPYANGPLHLGHLAGAIVPPDIMARYMRMLIGAENVLFVSGNDDHGSTSEVAAIKAGKSTREFIDEIHAKQVETTKRYGISYDIFSGTSQPDCFPIHKETSQEFMTKLWKNGMLEKKTTKQWFDPKLSRFLQDRYVTGKCPKCDNTSAYSDNCEVCGSDYDPSELINPKSGLSDATPELRDTAHLWLDMTKVQDQLGEWIKSKQNKWRKGVFNEVFETVQPALQFSNVHEPKFKEIRETLPKHKSRYAPGKMVIVQFENKADYTTGSEVLKSNGIEFSPIDAWARRSITRDITWGIPVPAEIDPEMKDKTLYVWPDSLIAPISFSKVALKNKGKGPDEWKRFWKDPDAKIFQFLGQDNVYFYVLMQGAMWLGVKDGYTMTDVYSVFHLMVNGEKMSKSRGNFYSADQLLDDEDKNFSPDEVRYFLCSLGLADKQSNFDFETFREKNKFLQGPLASAFDKPISAAHSHYEGKVPKGELLEKIEKETIKIVQLYLKSMEKADYVTLLGQLENYARQVNSLFAQYKPHDDRAEATDRFNSLYSSFYVIKNLMIMLYPFIPQEMDKVRVSLNLDNSIWSIDELGTGFEVGHPVGKTPNIFQNENFLSDIETATSIKKSLDQDFYGIEREVSVFRSWASTLTKKILKLDKSVISKMPILKVTLDEIRPIQVFIDHSDFKFSSIKFANKESTYDALLKGEKDYTVEVKSLKGLMSSSEEEFKARLLQTMTRVLASSNNQNLILLFTIEKMSELDKVNFLSFYNFLKSNNSISLKETRAYFIDIETEKVIEVEK